MSNRSASHLQTGQAMVKLFAICVYVDVTRLQKQNSPYIAESRGQSRPSNRPVGLKKSGIIKRNEFAMLKSSKMVQFKETRRDNTAYSLDISKDGNRVFSSVRAMRQSFRNPGLATYSITKFDCRAWEASRDFCNRMVEYGNRNRLQDTNGYRMYSEW